MDKFLRMRRNICVLRVCMYTCVQFKDIILIIKLEIFNTFMRKSQLYKYFKVPFI